MHSICVVVLRLLLIPQGDTSYLIYSYHAEDPVNNEQFSQHQFQGSITINLFGQPESVPSLPDDVQSFRIADNNVSNMNCTHTEPHCCISYCRYPYQLRKQLTYAL